MTLEDLARRRVEGDDQLAPYAAILLKDWHPGHYDWVATGNGDDLLTWAKTLEVAQGLSEDAGDVPVEQLDEGAPRAF